jgi:hypothetical protein
MYDKCHADYARQDKLDLALERMSHETKEFGSWLNSFERIKALQFKLSRKNECTKCFHFLILYLTAQKQNQQLHQPFMPSKETNESQKHVGTADTKKLRGNENCEKTGLLSCLGVEFLSLPRFALPFPQLELLQSVTCVELRLVTILENWARAYQGNWQPQRDGNFRELLSRGVEHVELNEV